MEMVRLLGKQTNLLFTSKTKKLEIVKANPDDDKFIECAIALNAEYIITGDKALKNIKNYAGIKILSPKEFLSRMTF